MTWNRSATIDATENYDQLLSAVRRVALDVSDWCDDERAKAEQRTGTTDPDTVVLDPDYRNALGVYSEIARIQLATEHFHDTWIGRL